MSRSDHERLTTLLAEALALQEADRPAFVQRSCADDADMRRELEELIECSEKASKAFDLASTQVGRADPQQIGPYRILETIGEGGMAVVYKAQQESPVRRVVAIKIIKLGMDTKRFIARFEAERQMLAMMDHPNVARVFDAGATALGRPYFVMEFVPGEPILPWCDKRRLGIRQRLELFIYVCEAVESAHRKGIIHRDLKNSNVLITQSSPDAPGTPKVIDFGVAKAISQQVGEGTMVTEQGQIIGTPGYMSPEQVEHGEKAVDTRSDVFSLGVLLYELLTGARPIDADAWTSGSYEKLLRAMREVNAPVPTARLMALPRDKIEDIAQKRGLSSTALLRQLAGELAWVPLKAMRKDREQRYCSASELADDIRNYLGCRPLIAGPESKRYRFGKFIRRQRAAAFASAVSLLALVAATGLSMRFGFAERRQRQAAETARDELEQVVRFQEGQFDAINAEAMGQRLRSDLMARARAAATRANVPGEEIEQRISELQHLTADTDFTGLATESLEGTFFVPALSVIKKQFADRPAIQARLLHTMAMTQVDLGLYGEALKVEELSFAIRRKLVGDEHIDALESLHGMGFILQNLGKLDKAELCLRSAMDGFGRLYGADHRNTLGSASGLATTYRLQGRLNESEQLHRKTLEAQRRVLGSDHYDTLESMRGLVAVLQDRNETAEAEKLLRELIERSTKVNGPDHPNTIGSQMNLGAILMRDGKLDDAEPVLQSALANQRRALGDDHPLTLSALGNVGLLYRNQGRFAEAEACYRELLQRRGKVLGEGHSTTLLVMHNLASLLFVQGRLDEAEPIYRVTLEKRQRLLSADHPDVLVTMNSLARLLIERNKLVEAEPYCRDSLERYRRVLGDEVPDTLVAIRTMGRLLDAQGKSAEAVAVLVPAEAATRKAFTGGKANRLGLFLTALGRARAGTGDFAAAEANLNEAHEILSQSPSTTEFERRDLARAIIELHSAWNRAQPNSGHDKQEANWRAKLDSASPITQPATRPAAP